ncbi:MAG: FAD-dependent monooxygenase, partial [Mucilaginibacter polytrichastri]|nr:FAD-dependent monooxygenase [Mucilaginibacter polytrichastri]
GPSAHSKAMVVQARTLELYAQMGIAAEAVENGRKLSGLQLHAGDAQSNIELGEAVQDVSEFAFPLIYEQNKNERLLLAELTRKACPVLWEHELTDYKNEGEKGIARLRFSGGEKVISCRYLIGADGARSRVRKISGIAFGGGTYPSQFFLADVRFRPAPDENHMHFFLRGRNFLGIFPMQDRDMFRLIGILPKALRNRDDLVFDDVLPHIRRIIPVDGPQCAWFSLFRLHYRHVNAFSNGRVFLAGDAAHIHSPAGGQGMNTGLQDAANLGWKLAGVLKGDYPERMLATYNEERLPLARELVRSTDRAFSFLTSPEWLPRTLRKLFLPLILRYAGRSQPNVRNMFSRISQTAIHYRKSSLSMHLSHRTQIRAGDRLPYFRLFDEKKQGEISLHEWTKEPGFSLILMDRLNRIDMATLRRWISTFYPGVNTYYLPWSEKNEPVFAAFEVPEHDKKMILVRPDQYIALIADGVDLLLLRRYFEQVIGFSQVREPTEAPR